jgi:hypothetical protein
MFARDNAVETKGNAPMSDPTIVCPSCSKEIKLTESLSAPLIQATREEYEAKIAQKDSDISKREAVVKAQFHAIEEAKRTIDEQLAERLQEERAAIAVHESKKARAAVAADLAGKSSQLEELQGLITQRDFKLREAQKAQTETLRKQRELDDALRELDLTIERRVAEAAGDIRERTKLEVEESLKLRVAEKEQQISSMQRQIEELRRKAEQGSQQSQGEILELQLEATLRSQFPVDTVEPIAKGDCGADVLQQVVGFPGQVCGAILWEAKRTKNWNDGWLAKLRADQRAAGAEFAVLVSRILPRGIDTFGNLEGIWITDARYVVPLAFALRQTLIEVSAAKNAQEGQETKMELMYGYLTGPKFRHRVEALAEIFSDMQGDLQRERAALTRLWAKRESQILKGIGSTVGMYGDLQGIAGKALQEIEGLDVPALLESVSE